jgi:hypothetical protein
MGQTQFVTPRSAEDYELHHKTFKALFDKIAETKAEAEAELETQEAKDDANFARMLKETIMFLTTVENKKMRYYRMSLSYLQKELAQFTVELETIRKESAIYHKGDRNRALSKEVSSLESEISSDKSTTNTPESVTSSSDASG